MGLEAVKDEILANARRQEASLIAGAKKEAERMMNEAQAKVTELREKTEAETVKLIAMIRGQEAASAELENKKMVLEAKKEAIENAFEDARKRIVKFGGKSREDCMKKLLEKARNDIDVAKVYCNENDAKHVKGAKAETADIMGGLIAENSDGTVRVDYSFDTLLQNARDNELQKINMILFG